MGFMVSQKCRFCSQELNHSFINLGVSPLANDYLAPHQLNLAEKFYPLHTYVCSNCWLVQLEEFEPPSEIFSDDYAYFSSYSDSWLRHAKTYTAKMINRFSLNPGKQVIEIASNDGYLLQFFLKNNIPVLGVEPVATIARVAEAKGIPTLVQFFGVATAEAMVAAGQQADLLLGNNVLAHVPDLNDFVAGLKLVLKPSGVLTMEFPHLLQLVQQSQFDTIYHEHFCYFSLLAVEKIFATHGLMLFDVEELPTHGGSLRIYAQHDRIAPYPLSDRVHQLQEKEQQAGLDQLETYTQFNQQAQKLKYQLLKLLIDLKSQGQQIVGYGAAAKGNTLLNYCGIGTDFLDYVCDRNPHKQEKFLPGTHIPIYPPEKLQESRPDYVLILPWNIKEEVMEQTSFVRGWGGKFIVPIPQTTVIP